MIDVAACFHRLARCRSIRRAMEASAERALTETDIARLAVLAFLHDVGKANSGFQAKRWRETGSLLLGRSESSRGTAARLQTLRSAECCRSSRTADRASLHLGRGL
jgi:hypothetical protein